VSLKPEAQVFAPISNFALDRGDGLLRAQAQEPVRFVDTTMLYSPKSGGVKRYLMAKRDWLAAERPAVRHSLVVPGASEAHDGEGLWSIYTAALPLPDGYRFPATKRTWCKRRTSSRRAIHTHPAWPPCSPARSSGCR